MVKKTKDQKLEKIKKIIKELLDLIGIKAKVNIALNEDIYQIQIETDEPGILIGYHGETIRALQKIVAMIAFRQLKEWQRIVVNVGDYQERRKETLEKMAMAAAQKARFSQQSQPLPPMPSSERRIIHLTLTGQTDIETISEGEGRNRYVIVRLKS